MSNIASLIRKVLAIELLEYEDKNYLQYDDKRNCEEKIGMLREALDISEKSITKEIEDTPNKTKAKR